MNATPVITPATVTEVLQLVATEFLSKKKNAVAANMPIEIIQNDIPTKSSEANKIDSAFATLGVPARIIRTKAKIFNLHKKNLNNNKF